MMRAPLRLLALAVAFAAASPHSRGDQPHVTYFRAVARTPTQTFLLDEQGESVYAHRGGSTVNEVAKFRTSDGKAWSWGKMPMSFASWHGDFLVVNGTNVLERFAADGRHSKRVSLPVTATGIVSTAKAVWLYSGLPSFQGARFWRSTDGEAFSPLNVPLTAHGDVRSRLLQLQIVFASDADGTLYFARSIGEPVVHKRLADGKDQRVTVAYTRSRERSRATGYVNGKNDLTTYSLPVADLFIDARGRLVVTRNREDGPGDDGRSQAWLRRRVDLYDPRGRHTATATFPVTIRTVLRIEDAVVIAATNDGRIIRARLGAPEPGGIRD